MGTTHRCLRHPRYFASPDDACNRSSAAWAICNECMSSAFSSSEGGKSLSLKTPVNSATSAGVRLCRLAICFSQESFRLAHASRIVRYSTSCGGGSLALKLGVGLGQFGHEPGDRVLATIDARRQFLELGQQPPVFRRLELGFLRITIHELCTCRPPRRAAD